MEAVIETARGPVLVVRVRAGARAGSIEVRDGVVRVAVTENAERGKANAAVRKALGRALGVPPSSLELIAGATAKDKRVLCTSVDAATLRARLQQLLA